MAATRDQVRIAGLYPDLKPAARPSRMRALAEGVDSVELWPWLMCAESEKGLMTRQIEGRQALRRRKA